MNKSQVVIIFLHTVFTRSICTLDSCFLNKHAKVSGSLIYRFQLSYAIATLSAMVLLAAFHLLLHLNQAYSCAATLYQNRKTPLLLMSLCWLMFGKQVHNVQLTRSHSLLCLLFFLSHFFSFSPVPPHKMLSAFVIRGMFQFLMRRSSTLGVTDNILE